MMIMVACLAFGLAGIRNWPLGGLADAEWDRGFRLVTYNELVVGPYAAGSLAVVVRKDDLSL
jgi:hypothetical protein